MLHPDLPGLRGQFRAPILGFRVASSGVPGRDFAAYCLDEISGSMVGGMPSTVLDLDKVIAVQKHRIVCTKGKRVQQGPGEAQQW